MVEDKQSLVKDNQSLVEDKQSLINNFTKLIAFDATSLYPSAMVDKDSKLPDASFARAFRQEEEQEFLHLFNSQRFRPRTVILTVLYKYPNDLFFKPIPAEDKI